MKPSKAILASALIAAAFSAAPASAVVTTFAQYQPIGTGANVYFRNNGTNGSNGSGGSFYTIAAANGTTAGSRNVTFSFLQPSLNALVGSQVASFTLFGSVVNSPAVLSSGVLTQQNISGTFSFVTTQEIIAGGRTFAAGSNLLSATFVNAEISGVTPSSSGSFTSNNASVVYTSDFLTFDNTLDRDFAFGLTSITSPLVRAGPTTALRNFRAVSTGTFSSDPAPLSAIPEPEMWGLMVVGFGLVGVQMRRRKTGLATIAA